MKNYLKLSTLVAVVAAMTACQDHSLVEQPSDFVSPTNFYKTQADALSALTGAYATFVDLPSPLGNADYFGRNLMMLVEYPTEVTTSRLSVSNERSLIGGYSSLFNSTHPYIQSVWEAGYFGINKANTVIDRVPAINMDPTRRDQIVAEAKFLRAMHYYFLAGLFGGVPLKLSETVTIGSDTIARATAADTWLQIEKDLTEAAAVLPIAWTSDFGRATKGAALTLLGKAYLQAAATGAGTSADYTNAANAFRTVIGLGYILDPNYAGLFDGTNETSKEIIWSIQNIRQVGAGGYLDQWYAPITNPQFYQPIGQNQFQAERPFYESYNVNDIRKAGTWLLSFTNAGKTNTWVWTSTNTSGITAAVNYGSTGPVPRKYLDLSAPVNGAGGIDYPYLRYADVLLSVAEAINNGTGPNGEAYGYVNQVRARAKVPNMTAGLTQAAFRDSLSVERRFELAMEGHGVFDSRRNWTWAKARIAANVALIATLNKSPYTSSVEKNTAAAPVADKWQLYPIPAHACELNAALTQNPGWEDGICK